MVRIRARLHGARWSLAHRGELRRKIPTGYVWDERGRVVLDPDQRVRSAIRDLFARFEQIGSACGVVRSYARDGLLFPRRDVRSRWDGPVRWRALGDYSLEFWIMVICNTLVPLLFFIKKIRTSITWLFVISILVNIGMWYERFVIIIGGVAHGFIPHAWGLYSPTLIELGIMLGAFSLFGLLFVLFVKHLPSVSMTEMKEIINAGEEHAK